MASLSLSLSLSLARARARALSLTLSHRHDDMSSGHESLDLQNPLILFELQNALLQLHVCCQKF